MGRKIPPTKKSSTSSNASDVSTSANNMLTRQTATEKELLKRVANLEKIVEKLQNELYVTKNINTLLSNEIDDLQQYQRRHCIVIDGLRTSPNETSDQVTEKAEKVLTENLQFDPEEVKYQIDKCHRRTNQHQRRYAIDDSPIQNPLLQRSCLLKKTKMQQKQKIKLSLTQRRRKTLTYAYNNADKLPEIDFFYVDIHSNLKFRLKNPINNKFVYSFRDKGELLKLFEKFGWELGNFDVESEGGLTGDNEEQD